MAAQDYQSLANLLSDQDVFNLKSALRLVREFNSNQKFKEEILTGKKTLFDGKFLGYHLSTLAAFSKIYGKRLGRPSRPDPNKISNFLQFCYRNQQEFRSLGDLVKEQLYKRYRLDPKQLQELEQSNEVDFVKKAEKLLKKKEEKEEKKEGEKEEEKGAIEEAEPSAKEEPGEEKKGEAEKGEEEKIAEEPPILLIPSTPSSIPVVAPSPSTPLPIITLPKKTTEEKRGEKERVAIEPPIPPVPSPIPPTPSPKLIITPTPVTPPTTLTTPRIQVPSVVKDAGTKVRSAVYSLSSKLGPTAIGGGIGALAGTVLAGLPGGLIAGGLGAYFGRKFFPSVIKPRVVNQTLINQGGGQIPLSPPPQQNQKKKWPIWLWIIIAIVVGVVGFQGYQAINRSTSQLPRDNFNVCAAENITQCLFYATENGKQVGYKIGNPELAAYITETSNKIGIPPSLLAGILRIESPTAFVDSNPEYFSRDWDNHPSFTNCCFGIMQFSAVPEAKTFVGVFDFNKDDLKTNFGKDQVTDNPNVPQADYENPDSPNFRAKTENVLRIYSIRDSLIAAAYKIKNDNPNPDGSWDENAVREVARKYYGRCDITDGSGNKVGDYCDNLWRSYSECKILSPSSGPLGFTVTCPLDPVQNTNFKVTCGTETNPVGGCGHGGEGYEPVCNPTFYVCNGSRYSDALYHSIDAELSSGQESLNASVYLPFINGNQLVKWKFESTVVVGSSSCNWGWHQNYSTIYNGKKLLLDITHVNEQNPATKPDSNNELPSGTKVGTLSDGEGGCSLNPHLHTALSVDGVWVEPVKEAGMCGIQTNTQNPLPATPTTPTTPADSLDSPTSPITITKGNNGNTIALTIDFGEGKYGAGGKALDGSGTEDSWPQDYVDNANLILKILRERSPPVKVTMFLTGAFIEDVKNKDLINQMILDGHEIGNHTYDHKSATGQSSSPKMGQGELNEQISTTEEKMLQKFNHSTKPYFRFPFFDGVGDINLNEIVFSEGYYNVSWTGCTPRGSNGQLIEHEAVSESNNQAFINSLTTDSRCISPGSQVLLHGYHDLTVENLDAVLDIYEDPKGLSLTVTTITGFRK